MKYTKEEQKQHRQELIAALRSGKYKQGRAHLRPSDGERYCCLGVACEISRLAKWNRERYLSRAYDMPREVMDYYGFATSDASFRANSVIPGNSYTGKGDRSSLVFLNDAERFTFEEIAAVIESEPEGMFV